MPGDLEITVGDVSNVEARVIARYAGAAGHSVQIRGTLRGPYCAGMHTLPAEYAFRESAAGEAAQAEAIVVDPCVWTPEMPHVYQADVEARQSDRIVAEYHGQIGLRRLQPRREGYYFP
jgi:beta-galactosidase/beta-glucuronidase